MRADLLVPPLPNVPLLPQGERIVAHAISLGGHTVHEHDDGDAAGFFHTYDELVACPGATPRKVHLLLPRDYASNTRAYPVVYMNDGHTAFWAGGATSQSWRAQGALSSMQAAGLIPPLIVIAVHPIDRESEYTPQQEGGGAATYGSYLASCLKPFIDGVYRTRPEREHTAIIGSSRGGLSAFYTATRHPEVFGFAGCLSPSFWAVLDDKSDPLPSKEHLVDSRLVSDVQTLLSDRRRRPRLWIDWGLRRDGGDQNAIIEALATARGREMVDILTQSAYRADEAFAYESPTGGHDEASWAARFPSVVAWFAGRQGDEPFSAYPPPAARPHSPSP